ncbi:NADAR family protein [Peterkaempfera bronchialis]|uniref:NADAR family protein n=1 Tax=Peterkaempfera bronchialis TaxID=2126346 RepID=A0A345SUT0_9ACTN|nr:NADAR family protein [Peterkaempfera bronchialis]AXI77485.1 NADAR family protein [Peterkaempfera bronchialis]
MQPSTGHTEPTRPTEPAAVRSRSELADLTASGVRPRYLMFWGPRPQRDGSVGAGCLSQWWPSPFTVDGVEYATAEHWMMAGKARLFGDEETLGGILAARTPGEARKLGRLVRGFREEQWARERAELVVEGNVAKFGQDAALSAYLLATRHRVLVEASPLDRIWGIGLAADDRRAADPARWRGLNLLGFALMEARRKLAD